MRLTATGVPRQQAFSISPKDPYQYQLSLAMMNIRYIDPYSHS